MSKPRVLVIGLDSASLPWVEKWAAEGHLPHLARVLEASAVGPLQSVNPPLSPAAWTSFATGALPARHGIFDHIYRRPGSYDIAPTNANLRRGSPLWRTLSEQGKTVGVINVPETFPPEPVNGFLISGMDTPSDDAEFAYPPELKGELERNVGGYRVFGQRSKENLDRSLEGMQRTIPMRVKAGRYLWETRKPDFMVLVFMETDVVQHKCWKYMDPQHPQFDAPETAAGRPKYGQAILDVYRAIDRQLGPWLETLDDETTLIVMSDHGAGPLRKFLYLNNWLLSQGLLKIKRSPLARLKYLAFRAGWVPTRAFNLAARMGLGIVDRVTDVIKRDMTTSGGTTLFQKAFLSWSDVEWPATKAYTLGGNFTGVYLNVRGREPQGCVEPGGEFEALRREIAERLLTWTDPDSGDRIVERVFMREELHDGPLAERAPDVIFQTRNEAYVGSGGHEFASNRLADTSPIFNGHHRLEGMVALKGPHVRAGRLPPQHIVDLAPTILHFLGVPLPEALDGTVMTAALEPDYIEEHPVVHQSAVSPKPTEAQEAYSPAEEQEVLGRLSDLGYL